jgi:hypothetical protein
VTDDAITACDIAIHKGPSITQRQGLLAGWDGPGSDWPPAP